MRDSVSIGSRSLASGRTDSISNPFQRGFAMNDDQVKGRADQLKGTIKEKTGQVIGNPDLENEGTADKVSGKVQSTVGDAKEKVKDAIDKI